MSCTKVSLLSRYGARDDRRVFLISPEMENKLSTGTDDALGVRNIRAIRLANYAANSLCRLARNVTLILSIFKNFLTE